MKTKKKIILAAIHLFITVATLILTIRGVFKGAGQGQLGENMINLGYFKAFTIDSNDLAGITSLLVFINLIISLVKHKDSIPSWAILLHYISAVALGLTFVTTATFLAPTQVAEGNSYWKMFSGDMFFMHFLTPTLVILSFIFGPKNKNFTVKENFLGLIPLVIYGTIYVINVVILGIWSDFYGFTFGGHYELVVPVLLVIFIVTFLIGKVTILCGNKFAGKE